MKKYEWYINYECWLKIDDEHKNIYSKENMIFTSEENQLEYIIHLIKNEINENIGTESEACITKVCLLGEIENETTIKG